MVKHIFKNSTCTCDYNDSRVDERVEIKLSKPFNMLQIEERNGVMIALYECGRFITGELKNSTFATSFDYDSNIVTLNCFVKEG
jgi:hypothetical protein